MTSNKENLHEGHRQRLKERFIAEGLDNFPEHNILELALFYTNKRKDTNEIAHALIKRFGSFAGVCDASFESLCSVPGVGAETAKFLKLLPELARAYQTSRTADITSLPDASTAIEYLQPKFTGRTKECLIVAYLDCSYKILNCRVESEGDDTTVIMDVSGILVEAASLHARGVVLAHNHPHGYALPSAQDIAMTDNIAKILKEINVNVCEHFIFSRDEVCRMSEVQAAARDFYSYPE